MKRFGRIAELLKIIWRDSTTNEEIELVPSTTASYTGPTVVELPPSSDTAQVLVEETATQSLENKTIDGTAATGNNSVTADADNITYDPSSSSIVATDLQAATDEVAGRLDTAESDIADNTTAIGNNATGLSDHLSDATDAHDASAISYDNATSGLVATDVQDAIDEVEGRLDTAETDIGNNTTAIGNNTTAIGNNATAIGNNTTAIGNVASDLSDHEAETSGAHAASAISYDDSSASITAATVQAAIDAVDSDVQGKQAADAELDALAGLATDGLIVKTGAGTAATRTLTGTTDEIDVADGDGVAGNPTVGISDNPVLPGTGAVQVPAGTTAQRPTGVNGKFRYNSDSGQFEGYASGAWGALAGDGGGGDSVNYLAASGSTNAETDIGSWLVSGAGLTFTRNTSTPLRGNGDFAFTKDAADRSGSYVYCPFVVDLADRNKVLGIWFDLDATDAAYVDGDVEVTVYDSDTAQEIIPQSPINAYQLKNGKMRFRVGFAPANTASESYELRINVASTNASTYTLHFDNFEVGPGNQLQYGFDGIWKTYYAADVTVTSSTITGSLTDAGSTFIPYKDTDGNWRLRGNLQYTFLSQSVQNETITLAGTVFKSDEDQAISASLFTTERVISPRTEKNTANLQFFLAAPATATGVRAFFDVALDSKPTWADFDPIATVYPTTSDLEGFTYIIDGQSSSGASDGVATDVGSGTVTVPPGTYILEYGAQGRVSYITTPPTSVQYALSVLDSSNATIAGVTSSMSPATSAFVRGNIDSAVEVTFTEEKTLNLSSTITVTGGTSISARNNFDGYLKLTRTNTQFIPPIGLEIAANGAPGLISAYEEGTWTPSEVSKSNLTGTSVFVGGSYTRIGRKVFVDIDEITGLSTTTTATRTFIQIESTGLPGLVDGIFYSGVARTKASGSEVTAFAGRAASSGNTRIILLWKSDGTGATAIDGISFSYNIQ